MTLSQEADQHLCKRNNLNKEKVFLLMIKDQIIRMSQ